MPVKIVNGTALIANKWNPLMIFFLLSSLDNLKACLTECKKQKYIVNAKIGLKK